MYPVETRSQFIELRAQGFSLRKAAEQLGVHRNTALEWDQQYQTEIHNLRSYEMEALQEQFLPACVEEMALLSEELKRINAELSTRDYGAEPTWLLANRQSMILARMDKLRLKPKPLAPLQNPDPPKSE
jgi:transposase